MEQHVKVFNKKLRELVHFENLGFQEIGKDDFMFSWTLKREIENKVDFIEYSFLKDKWGDDCKFNSISCHIVFAKVNKILFDILKDERYLSQWYNDTITRIPNFDLKVDDYVQKYRDLLFVKDRVINEQVFEEALELFQEQLQTTVLPFFDKIQTLQQVNDEILEKVDWNTYNKYISGEAGAKVLIIMKLCNNPRYEAYKKRSDKLIVEQLNDPKYAQYVDILQNQQIIMDEVYNYLESGKYLEEIA